MTAALEQWQDAEVLADEVARAHGLTVTIPLDDAGLRTVQRLVDTVWSSTEGTLVSSELLHALVNAGTHVVLASLAGEPVGAAIAFIGHDDSGSYLHSHMAGVLPSAQAKNVGFAMKLHQRAWALRRGMRVIAWTFDPLVRRNA